MKKFIVLALVAVMAAPAVSFAQKTTVQKVTRNKTFATTFRDVSIWYQGEVNLGYAVSGKMYDVEDNFKWKTNFSRPFIETTHGVRVTQYGYLGLGLGLQYAGGKILPDYKYDKDEIAGWRTLLMPIYVNLKGYYPVTDDLSPYITLSLGGSPVLTSSLNYREPGYWEGLTGGFYCKFGAGISWKMLTFDFGVMHQGLHETLKEDGEVERYPMRINSFYLNVGFKF
ncbi:MAG: hypothetical protein J1E04_03610 [Alistipes sp.]|nr:hypothetical protein [Alistipes sp.]